MVLIKKFLIFYIIYKLVKQNSEDLLSDTPYLSVYFKLNVKIDVAI